MVAWRRGHRVTRRGNRTKAEQDALPLIANATVNRSATKVLQRLFAFAKSEGARVRTRAEMGRPIAAGAAGARARTAGRTRPAAFDDAMRDDYATVLRFRARQRHCGSASASRCNGREVNFGTQPDRAAGQGRQARHVPDHRDDPRDHCSRCKGSIPISCSPMSRCTAAHGSSACAASATR